MLETSTQFNNKNFSKDETYALTDQLRRSASSISANIAEGSGSSSKKVISKVAK